MKKKGFTLIEVIIYISLLIVVLDCAFSIFIYFYKDYKNNIKLNSHRAHIDEIWIFLEGKIKEANTYAEVYNDSMRLKKYDKNLSLTNSSYEVIRLNGDKLIIEYYRGNTFQASNLIANNIEKFQVYRKDNLILIALTSKKGVIINKCIENLNLISVRET